MQNNSRLIKEFKIDNVKKSFIHPLVPNKVNVSDSDEKMNIYLLTIGHLWLYKIVEKNGNNIYLTEIIKYAKKTELTLFEWELTESHKKDISDILSKYNITFSMYLNDSFNIRNYDTIIQHSKCKDHFYHTLTRALFLAKYQSLPKFILNDESTDIIEWEEHTSVINATFLGIWMHHNMVSNIDITAIPEFLINIINKNMSCYVEETNLRKYPRIDYIYNCISIMENGLSENWYLISDEDQVILSKFLYSLQLVKELIITPMGINGILATFVTRTLFDNLWQSKYLITENKIDDYRLFALDRMRLHVIKRSDMPDVKNINELLAEIEGNFFDPIPINGDYFTKSAREYAIKLDLKDEYDKYYEYNSEFIHASLTAVYSGIMCRCSNPEHNMHLTINSNKSGYIDCAKHIFEIINMHIDILNNYFEDENFSKFDLEQIFFNSYSEYRDFINEIHGL